MEYPCYRLDCHEILDSGGADFAGSSVSLYIINKTDDYVINLDKLNFAVNRELLQSVSGGGRYLFEQAGICDKAKLNRIFWNVETCLAL